MSNLSNRTLLIEPGERHFGDAVVVDEGGDDDARVEKLVRLELQNQRN